MRTQVDSRASETEDLTHKAKSRMATIAFKVPAVPVAQPRARATAVNGKARMYEAKKSHPIHSFKATCRMAASQAWNGAPLDGPLSMELTFVFPAKRKFRCVKPTKPDLDNLAKSLADSLNELLYKDDGQIVSLLVKKYYGGQDEQPHVDVKIDSMNDL